MENNTASKSVKLGVIMTNKNGNKTIKLGNVQDGEFAKYNYTVQLRVLDASGKVVHTASNPWIALKEPGLKKDGTKGKVEYELQVFKE